MCERAHVKAGAVVGTGSLLSFGVVVGPSHQVPPQARISLCKQLRGQVRRGGGSSVRGCGSAHFAHLLLCWVVAGLLLCVALRAPLCPMCVAVKTRGGGDGGRGRCKADHSVWLVNADACRYLLQAALWALLAWCSFV